MAVVVQVISSSTTWVCPAGVTSIKVECFGGGGDGGTIFSSGGGSGGYYARKNALSVTPGSSYTAHVSFGSGDDTYFNTSGTVCAEAGAEAGSAPAGTTVGDVTFAGGTGAIKLGKGNTGGSGGGSGASDNANGNNGSVNSGATGGSGGATTTGIYQNGGAGGTGGTYNTINGTNGTTPGGGGGGGYTGGTGGAGAPGLIIITYTEPGTYVEHARYDAKPNYLPQVNFALPIAQGMCGCYLFNERGGKVARDIVGKMGNVNFSSSPIWVPRGIKVSNGTGNLTGTNLIKSAFNPVAGNCTIRIVHIPNSWPGSYTCIVEAYASGVGSNRIWDIFSDGSSITYRGLGGADGSATANTLKMPVNQLADLVWVRRLNDTATGSTQVHYWYLNGKLIFKETGFANNAWPTTGHTLTFGGNPSGGGSAYDGTYLKAQMWNRALHPSEVAWAAANPWGDLIDPRVGKQDAIKRFATAVSRKNFASFGKKVF